MKVKEKIVKQIIEWSQENTAGTVLSELEISMVVKDCINSLPRYFVLNLDKVDNLISEHEGGNAGFLIKASDVLSAFKKYNLSL